VCERLYRTPIPLVYTRHTGRFLGVYMLLLPMALWGELGGNWAVVPASVTIAVFLFGIEELGIQIEEPFSILPLDSMCDSMQATIADLLRVEDPDNPSHVYSLGYDFLPPIGSDAKPLSESPLKRNYSGGEDRSRDYSEDSEEESDSDDDD
jgi:predicted membrane chloride channel (bestrophin family)